MEELIKIKEENGQQLVSARELYLGLGLDKSQWSRWNNKNIKENDFFLENQDWTGVRLNVEGNEVQDFAISLEFAKHIAMMARTKKSHEYRNYFIVCEKKLKEIVQPKLPTYSEALRQLADKIEQNEKLTLENTQQKQLIGEMKPKVEYVDIILKSKDTLTVTQIAKDYGITAQKLNEILKDNKVQYKQRGQWLLYAKYLNMGYTRSHTVSFTHSDGEVGTKLNTKWTQKGRLFINDLLKSKGIIALVERDSNSIECTVNE